MKKKDLMVKVVLIAIVLLLLISLAAPAIFSQPAMLTPRRETLLNGTRLITHPDAKADKVWVRIRVHSGSAFDPQGKEGVMRLLSQNLFPNPAAGEFFEEDLEGSLNVLCGYDFIQITASSKPEEFLTMLETLATAVSSPTIDKETTDRLKADLNLFHERNKLDNASMADEAAKERLFGTFPYGRPTAGTKESLSRITFADIIEARKRFLTADNTSVVISGRFDRALATRAAKRYFGGWLKSDRKVPSTFKRPEDPPAEMAALSSPAVGEPEVRFAMRGVARSDKEFPSAEVFAQIMQERLVRKAASNSADVRVSNVSLTLPGYLMIRFSAAAFGGPENTSMFKEAVNSAISEPIDAAEFTAARRKAADVWRVRPSEEFWLDADTYKLTSAENDARSFDSINLADVKAFAEKISRSPMVSLVMLPAETPK
ncbi:MAG: insulinase family protein [Acidobacteriota bacterium]|nr:MAG: insulinase family protein [Acidobacteriota bacterium]